MLSARAVEVTPFEVDHPCGAPPYALRIAAAGKILTYSGDTQWTDALVSAAQGADLLIAEALHFERKVKYHLDYKTLVEHLPRLGAKRVVLTHFGPEMLANLEEVDCETAYDGLSLEV